MNNIELDLEEALNYEKNRLQIAIHDVHTSTGIGDLQPPSTLHISTLRSNAIISAQRTSESFAAIPGHDFYAFLVGYCLYSKAAIVLEVIRLPP